jgi:hypothetical protein
MFYWFERAGVYLRCEVRDVGGHYELTLIRPDGTECVERFDDSEQLYRRQLALELRLIGDGWSGPHGRGV